MRLLRMIIVPLVFASIVSGVASIGGGRAIGRLFSKTLGYYLLTSFLAATTGLIAVNLFRPGVGASLGDAAAGGEMPELDIPTSGTELLLDIVPPNVLTAAAAGDMLPVIFFSIVLGAAIASLKADGARGTLIGFFNAFFQAMVALTSGIIKLLPIGVFALITRMVGTTGFESFAPLIRYLPDRRDRADRPPLRHPARRADRARPHLPRHPLQEPAQPAAHRVLDQLVGRDPCR